MIVAMAVVGVMQVATDEVIGMITVGHGLMAAAGTVDVAGIMRATLMRRRTGVGVPGRDLDAALVDVVAVHGVEAAVVEVVDVIAVADGRVAAALAVDVGMLRVDPVLGHGQIPVISESAAKG